MKKIHNYINGKSYSISKKELPVEDPSKGEVIGVNSAGYTFSQNIAYAIPTHIIVSVLNDLLNTPNKIIAEPLNKGISLNLIINVSGQIINDNTEAKIKTQVLEIIGS